MAIAATVLVWLAYTANAIGAAVAAGPALTADGLSVLIMVTLLAFATVMYLMARGATLRRHGSTRTPRGELPGHFDTGTGSMTVLVPPHTEPIGSVRASVWAAALQEYPALRVVLLLDERPWPRDPSVAERLAACRGIAPEISRALAEPGTRFGEELLLCEIRLVESHIVTVEAVVELIESYDWADEWLARAAGAEAASGRSDSARVLSVLAGDLRAISGSLRAAGRRGVPSPERMLELHQRLAWTFSVELDTFELDARGAVTGLVRPAV